jgi:hypothetical protein
MGLFDYKALSLPLINRGRQAGNRRKVHIERTGSSPLCTARKRLDADSTAEEFSLQLTRLLNAFIYSAGG